MAGQGPTGIERFDTGVDLSGLMAVLSKHLYTTPDVAVRELVQNAHDSITARRGVDLACPEPAIDIEVRQSPNELVVADNGIGLRQTEIHALLATVGASGKADPVTGADGPIELIGQFGLGFLSAFVIADEVIVTTTSLLTPDEAWEYRSFDGYSYSVLPAPPREVGTTVTLRLKSSHDDLAVDRRIDGILERYCRLLDHPIRRDGGDPINLTAPWRGGDGSPVDDEERLAFARDFSTRFEPIATIPVSTDGALVDGLLWVHAGTTYGNADNRNLSVYLHGMLLAENDVELLPRWAGFISGVIESPQLTPTASRETLKQDTEYTEAQMVIGESLVTGLAEIARTSPATWRRITARHGESLLGAAVTDDRLFELIVDEVTLPTSRGPMVAQALRVGRRIHVSLGAERGFEDLLFLSRGVPVAHGHRHGVLAFLRRYAGNENLELIEIGTDAGNAALFDDVQLPPDDLAWLTGELATDNEAVYPARFDPPDLPLVVIPDREAELKRRVESDELDAVAGSAATGLARLHTAGIGDRPDVRVYVNLACPTVERLLAARTDLPVAVSRGTAFLRALKALMVASDRDRDAKADLTAAFGDVLTVLDGLLLDAGSPDSGAC